MALSGPALLQIRKVKFLSELKIIFRNISRNKTITESINIRRVSGA
jgi:hypothetical protein